MLYQGLVYFRLSFEYCSII